MISVELFGVPRLRAGTARVTLEAATVGDALTSLGEMCHALRASVLDGRGVSPAYRLSLNGDRFIHDPETPLNDGDCLILLSADVGG